MIRFLTRLRVYAALSTILILYITLWYPSTRIQNSIRISWRKTPRRVIVFGDDWSDTGKYRMAPPPSGTMRDRSTASGVVWTETLCKELKCDSIDNFARSVPSSVSDDAIGAMVDSGIFNNATCDNGKHTQVASDFQAQVKQFIEFEKRTWRIPGRHATGDGRSIFTVFFGIWDLLQYSLLDIEGAKHAIDNSVEELLHNLDLLVDHVGAPIEVVVPMLVDVTFLPRFSSKKDRSAPMFAQDQHQAVYLWTYWNMRLSQRASEWVKGDLFIPDFHGIVMDQVRAKQLYAGSITDATGSGKQVPLFEEVEQPCLASKTDANAHKLQAADTETCHDPSRFLFWDDMHLSSAAHQLIGKEAARLVYGNKTVNRDARRRVKLPWDSNTKEKQGASFNLKFPPGY